MEILIYVWQKGWELLEKQMKTILLYIVVRTLYRPMVKLYLEHCIQFWSSEIILKNSSEFFFFNTTIAGLFISNLIKDSQSTIY